MYPAANSQVVQLAANVSADATEIPVSDIAAFPPAPNVATIGMENDAEVILYNAIDAGANQLTGVVRSRSGTLARVWQAGENIYHSWTAENANAIMDNIRETIADLETKANLDGADFSGPVTIAQRTVVTAQEILTADKTIYVAKTGNDGTGDGSEGNPFLTIQRAVDYCYGLFGPQYDVTISIGAGTYTENVIVAGTLFFAALIIMGVSADRGAVKLYGQTQNNSAGAIDVYGTSTFVDVRNMTIYAAVGSVGISAFNARSTRIVSCDIIGQGAGSAGANIGVHMALGGGYIAASSISNYAVAALRASYGAYVTYDEMSSAGSGNGIGAFAVNAIIVQGAGPALQGATATLKSRGGQIFA